MHRTTANRLSLLFTSAVLVWSAAWAADQNSPVEFGPRWKVGQRLSYALSTVQDQKITSAMSPQPMDQSSRQTQAYAVTVEKEREGGGHELAVEFTGLSVESSLNGNTIVQFDSKSDPKDDAGNQAAAIMRPIANAKFRILTRANGKVDAVQGLKELLAKVSSSGNPMLAAAMESIVSEDAVKQMGIVPNWFPGKPVKPGDQWPVRYEVAAGLLGKIAVSQTLTFKGWEEKQGRRCVLIETKGYLSSSPTSGTTTNLISISSLSGDTKGRLWYDPELGALVESNEAQNMRMKMKAMGQEASAQMTQSVTNTLKEVAVAK
ncbi:MAG: hypothetical protein IPM17_02155 [Verrucomicrobia bacterium]|nr:hypothetical protein [Verrucomicrobiota bacterium]